MGATTTKRRTRASRGEGERLRSEIIEATAQLLGRMGSDEALSLRAVAREVGVSAPSVYLHFADKEELLVAVAAELFDDLQRALDEAAAGAGDDAVAALMARAHAYVNWGLNHPGHYKVLYEGALMRRLPDPGAQTLGRPALLALAADLERAIASGQLIPSTDEDLEGTARLLWQAVHGITSLRINKPAIAWDDASLDVERLVGAALGLS